MASVPQPASSVGYDTDLHAWLLEQAARLRAGRLDRLDANCIAEELEGLAGRDRRELESRLLILYLHLLKWVHQPDYPDKKSWRRSIKEQRRQIQKMLKQSPSLKNYIDTLAADAYQDARTDAADETGLPLSVFPEQSVWTLSQVLDDSWPDPDS